jgi:hypothetical protein
MLPAPFDENTMNATLTKISQPRPMSSHAPVPNALPAKKASRKEQNRKLPNDEDRADARRSLDRTAISLGYPSWALMLQQCHTHGALYRIDFARPGLPGAPDALGASLSAAAVILRAVGFPADLVIGSEQVLSKALKDPEEIVRKAVHVRDVGAPLLREQPH